MTPPLSSTAPVTDVLDRLDSLSQADHVSLARMVQTFGDASFVPALMVPALLVVSPLSGIPLFSSLCGLTIALIAAQMLARRTHLWVPGMLGRRRVAGRRMARAVKALRGPAGWLDSHTGARLRLLFRAPLSLLPPLMAMVCGLAMPFLELVPFSSSILGSAVLLISVGLLSRDGVWIVVAGAVMAMASAIPAYAWTLVVS